MTFETFDQSDEKTWPDPKNHPVGILKKSPCRNFEKNHPVGILKKSPCINFEKNHPVWILKKKSLCVNFENYSVRILKKSPCMNFKKITLCEFWKFLNFFDNFDNCWLLWQFLKQSCRLVTIETLITILRIENLNSWQSLLLDNQEWQWAAFAILAMFCLDIGYILVFFFSASIYIYELVMIKIFGYSQYLSEILSPVECSS